MQRAIATGSRPDEHRVVRSGSPSSARRVVTLNVILRNRASYAQAYPHLELTLTDTQDQTLARRTFSAAEYLKFREEEINGLAANRESSIKLYLDTNNLKAAGYKLFLFYPNRQS